MKIVAVIPARYESSRFPGKPLELIGNEPMIAWVYGQVKQTKGIDIRVVSMPNINRFLSQDKEYIDKVLPVEVKKIVIEASSSYSWNS